jgi:hypothetical protein
LNGTNDFQKAEKARKVMIAQAVHKKAVTDDNIEKVQDVI